MMPYGDVIAERLVKRGETSGRSDDNVDTALKRFHTYTEAVRHTLSHTTTTHD